MVGQGLPAAAVHRAANENCRRAHREHREIRAASCPFTQAQETYIDRRSKGALLVEAEKGFAIAT